MHAIRWTSPGTIGFPAKVAGEAAMMRCTRAVTSPASSIPQADSENSNSGNTTGDIDDNAKEVNMTAVYQTNRVTVKPLTHGTPGTGCSKQSDSQPPE